MLVVGTARGLAGALKTEREGVGDPPVRVTRVTSHAGLNFEKGHNAILELARQVLAIADFADLARGLTVSPGIIRGGTRSNVVPDAAEVEVDVRVTRLHDAEPLERRFRSLRPPTSAAAWRFPSASSSAHGATAGVARLFALAQELGQEIGWPVAEAAVGGGSDGNFTAALGSPTLDGTRRRGRRRARQQRVGAARGDSPPHRAPRRPHFPAVSMFRKGAAW